MESIRIRLHASNGGFEIASGPAFQAVDFLVSQMTLDGDVGDDEVLEMGMDEALKEDGKEVRDVLMKRDIFVDGIGEGAVAMVVCGKGMCLGFPGGLVFVRQTSRSTRVTRVEVDGTVRALSWADEGNSVWLAVGGVVGKANGVEVEMFPSVTLNGTILKVAGRTGVDDQVGVGLENGFVGVVDVRSMRLVLCIRVSHSPITGLEWITRPLDSMAAVLRWSSRDGHVGDVDVASGTPPAVWTTRSPLQALCSLETLRFLGVADNQIACLDIADPTAPRISIRDPVVSNIQTIQPHPSKPLLLVSGNGGCSIWHIVSTTPHPTLTLVGAQPLPSHEPCTAKWLSSDKLVFTTPSSSSISQSTLSHTPETSSHHHLISLPLTSSTILPPPTTKHPSPPKPPLPSPPTLELPSLPLKRPRHIDPLISPPTHERLTTPGATAEMLFLPDPPHSSIDVLPLYVSKSEQKDPLQQRPDSLSTQIPSPHTRPSHQRFSASSSSSSSYTSIRIYN